MTMLLEDKKAILRILRTMTVEERAEMKREVLELFRRAGFRNIKREAHRVQGATHLAEIINLSDWRGSLKGCDLNL